MSVYVKILVLGVSPNSIPSLKLCYTENPFPLCHLLNLSLSQDLGEKRCEIFGTSSRGVQDERLTTNFCRKMVV